MNSDLNYRKMKQKYLREQIIGQKWDPNEFSEYLATQREDGTNIDNWDFDELIKEVERFKNFKLKSRRLLDKNLPKRKSDNYKIVQEIKSMRQNLNTIVHQDQKQMMKSINEVDDEYTQYNQNNEQTERKEILLMRVHPKKKDRYIFKLLPDNKEFTRKLKDLYWLQSNLQIEFPFYYVIQLDPSDQSC